MKYAGIENLGSMVPDNLLAGPAQRVVKSVKIAPGQNLVRGTVLGKLTASGQCVPVDKSKSDGSQKVFAVLADDVITGEDPGDVEAYLSGEFAISVLHFGGSDTAADHLDQARELGIYFRETVEA